MNCSPSLEPCENFKFILYKPFSCRKGYHRNNLISLVVMTILFYLPQQRIFRDPVTRFFFEREWFRNYGDAFLFTQFLSFLILVLLLINAWSWFGAL